METDRMMQQAADRKHAGAENAATKKVRVRFHIIRNARIYNVGKFQSCMVSKLRIIWKQTVTVVRQEATTA